MIVVLQQDNKVRRLTCLAHEVKVDEPIVKRVSD